MAAAERDDARAEADAVAAALREMRERARSEAETAGERRRNADKSGREVDQLKALVSGLDSTREELVMRLKAGGRIHTKHPLSQLNVSRRCVATCDHSRVIPLQ